MRSYFVHLENAYFPSFISYVHLENAYFRMSKMSSYTVYRIKNK